MRFITVTKSVTFTEEELAQEILERHGEHAYSDLLLIETAKNMARTEIGNYCNPAPTEDMEVTINTTSPTT